MGKLYSHTFKKGFATPLKKTLCAALCVGPGCSLCRGPAFSGALCVGARRALCRAAAPSRAPARVCVFTHPVIRAAPRIVPIHVPSSPRASSSDARATQPVRGPNFAGPQPSGPGSPQLRSVCHPSACHPPRIWVATHPAHDLPAQIVPPIQPGPFPFLRREPQTLLFGGQRTIIIIIMQQQQSIFLELPKLWRLKRCARCGQHGW